MICKFLSILVSEKFDLANNTIQRIATNYKFWDLEKSTTYTCKTCTTYNNVFDMDQKIKIEPVESDCLAQFETKRICSISSNSGPNSSDSGQSSSKCSPNYDAQKWREEIWNQGCSW